MEYQSAYLYLLFFILIIACTLLAMFAVYYIQQQVVNVTVTSASVAFFPVRVTTMTVRFFFRITLLGFDVSLVGLRFVLVCFRWLLIGLETLLWVWQLPVVVLIGVVQRLRRMRKPKSNKKLDDDVDHVQEVANGKERERDDATKRDSLDGGAVPRKRKWLVTRLLKFGYNKIGLLITIVQSFRAFLRPDVLMARNIVLVKEYLRKRAGLQA